MEPCKDLPLLEAIRLATGRTVHIRTALRWCKAGVVARDGSRAILSRKKAGGRLVASVEDVLKWVERTNAPPPKRGRPNSAKAAIERYHAAFK